MAAHLQSLATIDLARITGGGFIEVFQDGKLQTIEIPEFIAGRRVFHVDVPEFIAGRRVR